MVESEFDFDWEEEATIEASAGFETQVKFNGIDVTKYVKTYDVEREYKNKTTVANILIASSVRDIVEVNNYTTVEIFRNLEGIIVDPDNRIFYGGIETAEIKAGVIKIYAEDEMSLLKTDINVIYLDTDPTAGKISDIFKDIVETQISGLTVDAQDSGTTVLVNRFACLNAEALERLTSLAGLLNWQFFQDPVTRNIIFRPMTFEDNPNTINYSTGLLNRLSWTKDDAELGNVITCVGGEQMTRTEETFSGDGTEKEFELTKGPVDIEVKVGGVIKKVGNEQSSNVDVYVDYDRKKIIFVTAPPSASNNIVVSYSYINPVIITVKDNISILSYKTSTFNGEFKRMFTYTDLLSAYDVETRAKELLAVYKDPFLSTNILVNNKKAKNYGLAVGQNIRVQDPLNNTDSYFLIKSHKMKYPMAYDEFEIGDEEVRLSKMNYEVLERLKRLEESSLSESDIAISLLQFEEDLPIVFEEMSLTYTYLNDSDILSNERHSHDISNVITREFELTDWTETVFDILKNTDTDYIIAGSSSLNVESDAPQTGNISYDLSVGDVSEFTGVSSGTPTQGTIGVWFYIPSGTTISNVKLQVGSDSSNYIEITGSLWANHCEVGGATNHPYIEGWNYMIFDLDDPASVTGTPDWTSVSYLKIIWDMNIGEVYIDLIGISGSNYSPSFLGYRPTYRTFEVI